MSDRAQFEIFIGASARDSGVMVNGIDITPAISGVTVSVDVRGETRVELRLVPGSARVAVKAALESVVLA